MWLVTDNSFFGIIENIQEQGFSMLDIAVFWNNYFPVSVTLSFTISLISISLFANSHVIQINLSLPFFLFYLVFQKVKLHLSWEKISYLNAKPCSLLGVHKNTQVENPGEGVAQIFASGVSKLSGKITWGVPYFSSYCIFIKKFFENCLGGGVSLHSPSPPVCICVHVW